MGGAPKGGSPNLENRKGAAPKGGARRVGAQNFALFFLSPTSIFILFFSLSGCLLVSFFFSLGVISWNFGGVLVGRDPQMCFFSPSGCRVEAPGGLQVQNSTR